MVAVGAWHPEPPEHDTPQWLHRIGRGTLIVGTSMRIVRTMRITHTKRTIRTVRTTRTSGTTNNQYTTAAHSWLTHVLMMPAIPKRHGRLT